MVYIAIVLFVVSVWLHMHKVKELRASEWVGRVAPTNYYNYTEREQHLTFRELEILAISTNAKSGLPIVWIITIWSVVCCKFMNI